MNDVVKEAQERWKYANQRENYFRQRFLSDLRFSHGDSDNNYMWEDTDRQSRVDDKRPTLTIKKTRQHNLNIINEAKQNKPAIKYMPTGNGATFEAAQIWMALARRIEAYSDAAEVYSTATEFMVNAGFGYARIMTEYIDEKSFQQQLRIARIKNPLTVYIDPDCEARDTSDKKYAFIYTDIPKAEYKIRHPKLAEKARTSTIGPHGWLLGDLVRTAEYYRIVDEDDVLWQVMPSEDDDALPPLIGFESEFPKDIIAQFKARPIQCRSRKSKRRRVLWSYIVGNDEVESNEWPGKYIPIIPWVAEEITIEGKTDRISHTRALKDPNRIYNWWSSASVEYGALQTKTPWVGPAEVFEGHEVIWNNANLQNKAYLPYNAFNEEGEQLPAPQRVEPPVSAPVAIQGMEIAAREMAMVSGQYDAQMGAPSNERSGKAIGERQRQSDRSTYHFNDAGAIAIKFIGKIIQDTGPRIWEPDQIIQILAEDGQSLDVKIDMGMQEAYKEEQDENGQTVMRILNPTIGQYDVIADVGPGYATRREETFNALVLLLTQAPQLATIIGDLLFRSGDFMFADEAAERLRRMVPPAALGQGPSEGEQQLQLQLQEIQKLAMKLKEENTGLKLKGYAKDEKRDVDIYRAFTERLNVLQDAGMAEQDHAIATVQLMRDLMNDSLDASQAGIDARLGKQLEMDLGGAPGQVGGQMAGMPEGVKLAPDGNHYVPHPLGNGFMKVVPDGQV